MSLGTTAVEIPCRDTEGGKVGACDGTNTLFLLTYRPTCKEAVQVFRNGLRQREGTDYSFAVQSVVFLSTPAVNDRIDIDYRCSFTV